MTVQLKINKTIFYLNALLFVSMSLVFVIGLYFSNNLDSYIVFIGSGMACFILPWSFFSAMSEWDKNQKQFQTLKIEDDFLLFENLPLQGGSTQFVQIDFKNIEKIQVKSTAIHVLFVRRYEWEGEPCDFITPSGFVPKLQQFSLTLKPSKRREIINLLESKGLIDNNKNN